MPTCIKPLSGCAYLAFDNMKNLLTEELENRFFCKDSHTSYENLFYYPDALTVNPAWAQTVLSDGRLIQFDSISEAANELRAIQRNWAPYSFTQFRRASLIQEKLPYINMKVRAFPFQIPQNQMGLWTLTDANTMIAFANSTSPFPQGKLELIEDHENPPSRAYLKLQEALLHFSHRFGVIPQAKEQCLDAGASPGGWTWVLTQLGCTVLAIDRAELDPRLMQDSLVTFTAHDAFTLPPEQLGSFDWIFSDVICYPERLLNWIHTWIKTGTVKNMICTVKMQGKTDWNLIKEFEAISGSFLQHLNYNKHELTWFYHAAQT